MRAVIFTDVPSLTSIALSRATLREAGRRPDFDVCGIVTRAADQVDRSTRRRIAAMARQAATWATGGPKPAIWDTDLSRLAGEADLPLIVAAAGVNDPAFVDRLHRELRPDVLLSYFATSIFRPALLDTFEQAVNYHDGLLPRYGGLMATAHSIHAGEPVSGYTFHRITVGIDEGPILRQGTVPVPADATLRSVSAAKVSAATTEVPALVDMVLARDPGVPQVGEGSYFSQADFRAVVRIEEPSALRADEIRQRLRAFGTLEIMIDGTIEHVTALTTARSDAPLSFPTADGSVLRATRIAGLPSPLIRARRSLFR